MLDIISHLDTIPPTLSGIKEEWDHFTELFRLCTSEKEAANLLYLGCSVGIGGDTRREFKVPLRDYLDNFLQKIVFFIHISERQNKYLAETAKQIIVKRLLRNFFALSWVNKQNEEEVGLAVSIFTVLADFLSSVDGSLKAPPYPRFVGEFLHFFIVNKVSRIEQCGGDVYNLSLLITPCIIWGRSDLIDRLIPQERKDAEKLLIHFLEDPNNDLTSEERVVVCLSRILLTRMSDPSDLHDDRSNIMEKATLALLLERSQNNLSEQSRLKIAPKR